MRRQRGNTLIELITVISVMGILAAVAVPSAASAKRAFAASSAVHRLTLVLRVAQARAQSASSRVCVRVDPGGSYMVTEGAGGPVVDRGELNAEVSSNYAGQAVEFAPPGWPCAPGATSPRAGRFFVADGGAGRQIVLQLGGCVRCE